MMDREGQCSRACNNKKRFGFRAKKGSVVVFISHQVGVVKTTSYVIVIIG